MSEAINPNPISQPVPNPVQVSRSLPTPLTPPPPPEGWRFDLLKAFPPLKWLVKQRWFQFALILPNLFLFLVFLAAGIWGTPVGNRNILIVFVWIFWWFLLISALVPFLSRIWCTVCPFPFFGEWIQRGSLTTPKMATPGARGTKVGINRYFGWNLRWPKALSNIWMQNISFLLLCTFSAFYLTRPIVSVVVLGTLIVVATILHVVFRQRAFCNYVCPVSGFLSLYAMTSTVEVRSKDADVCLKCHDKSCLVGSERGWGCPWFNFPSKMERNNYCGMCMECIKSCPHDNMTVRLRPFATDTKLKGYDEAWKAFIMLALALAYSVIYLGPWGFFKDVANFTESGKGLPYFIGYALCLWALPMVIIPTIFSAFHWLARRVAGAPPKPWKESFLLMAYPLVPLGLLAWIAFSLPLIFINGSYILVTMSDPFGWGWDLFHTAHTPWSPIVPQLMPTIQVAIMALGLILTLKSTFKQAGKVYEDAKAKVRFAAPMAIFYTAIVLLFIQLYVN